MKYEADKMGRLTKDVAGVHRFTFTFLDVIYFVFVSEGFYLLPGYTQYMAILYVVLGLVIYVYQYDM